MPARWLRNPTGLTGRSGFSHVRIGKRLWYLLTPRWHELPGVKDEAFVQGSGIWYAKWDMERRNYSPQRVLRLRELKLYGEKDGRSQAIALSVEIKPLETDTLIYNPMHLIDGNVDTFCSLSGSIATPQIRYRPLETEIRLTTMEAISPRKLLLNFGDEKNPDIGRVGCGLPDG